MRAIILCTILCIIMSIPSFATQYTWNGGTSTNWATTTNWTPNGTPSTNDTVTIVSATRAPLLDANRTVKRLTMTSGSLDLNSDTLTISTLSTFTAGTISNGVLKPQGTTVTFTGVTFNCTVNALSGQLKFNGGKFNYASTFEQNGSSTGPGAGGTVFNADVTIKNSGTAYLALAESAPDTFNANVIFIQTGSLWIQCAHGNSTVFNGNVQVNCTGANGISFNSAGSGTTKLATGKTISVGSVGFSSGTLQLKNFTQNGSTAQTITLTSSAILSLDNCEFNGAVTISTPNFLSKYSSFHGTTSITKSSTSSNFSDGGNHFYSDVTITNTASNTAALRSAVVKGDIFDANLTCSTTNGQIQLAYSDTTIIKGNISTNHASKIAFNQSNGFLKCTGSLSQQFNGTASYPIGKLIVDKVSGNITVNQPLLIDSSIVLISGIISNLSNLITVKSGCSLTGGNDSSYVEGPVKKIGNTAFTFPIGGGGKYYPLKMTAPLTSTDAFKATFFNTQQALGDSIDTAFVYISECHYWNFTRETGSSKVKISLQWVNDTCELNDPAELRIANWNTLKWALLDTTYHNGNYQSAFIQTKDSLNSFGNFVLGSIARPYTWANYFQDCTVTAAPSTSSVCSVYPSTSTCFVDRYNKLDTYIPQATDPVKTVLINLNIMQDDLGNGNFSPINSPQNADYIRLAQIMDWVNGSFYLNHQAYNQTLPNVLTPVPFINSTKIKFEFEVHTYPNSALINSTNVAALQAYVFSQSPSSMYRLNVYFTNGTLGSAGGFASMPSYTNMNQDGWIVELGRYNFGNVAGDYNCASNLAHELGHTLGLYHSYSGGGASANCNETAHDYLWDIFGWTVGAVSSLCPMASGQSNDLMGGNQNAKYTSPLQMGMMHRSLSLSNMRRYVKCEENYTGEFEITDLENWNFDIEVYRNIRIKSNGIMNLTCNLIMPEFSKIIIEDGGKMIVDGGVISSVCNLWDGIEVWGDRTISQYPYATTAQGVLEIINGSQISDAKDVATTIKYDPGTDSWDWGKTGGIIRAENSTFINNYRTFQFLSYQNFRPGYPTQFRNNLSYIYNCTFETNYTLLSPYVNPYASISMFDVKGIQIKGNTFRNTRLESAYYNQRERGAGIVSIDSRFLVNNYAGTDFNEFENLWTGVYVANSNSANTVSISDAVFDGCYQAVYANNVANLSFFRNSLAIPPRGPAGSAGLATYGLYLDNCYNYRIEENGFASSPIGDADFGIIVANCGDPRSNIYNNYFDGFNDDAIRSIDDNNGPNLYDGLVINCNDFDNQTTDEINVTKSNGSTNFGIGETQGSCLSTASASRNLFYSNVCAGSGLELKVNTSLPASGIIQYYSSNLNSDAVLDCYTSGAVINNLCSIDFEHEPDCPPLNDNTPDEIRDIINAYSTEIEDYKASLNHDLESNIVNQIRTMSMDSTQLVLIQEASPFISQDILIAIIDHLDSYYEAGYEDALIDLVIKNSGLTVGTYNYLKNAVNTQEHASQFLDSADARRHDINSAESIIIGLDEVESMRSSYIQLYLNECSNSDDTTYQSFYGDTCLLYLSKTKNYLQLHDASLQKGDYYTAEIMLDSIDAETVEPDFISILYSLDTLREGHAGFKAHSQEIEDELLLLKDGNGKSSALSRTLLTFNKDSLFFPILESDEVGIRKSDDFTFLKTDNFEVYLYPNPTIDILKLRLKSKVEIEVYFSIFDITGKEVKTGISLNGENLIDVKSLNSGVYIVNVSDGKGYIQNVKFIKM